MPDFIYEAWFWLLGTQKERTINMSIIGVLFGYGSRTGFCVPPETDWHSDPSNARNESGPYLNYLYMAFG